MRSVRSSYLSVLTTRHRRWLLTASAAGVTLGVVVGSGIMLVRAQAPPPLPAIGMVLDAPAPGSTVRIPFVVRGAAAAFDIGSKLGNAGIDFVTIDASNGRARTRLGKATIGVRDDRGDMFGKPFTHTGFTYTVMEQLPDGNYTFTVAATSLPDPFGLTHTTQMTTDLTVDDNSVPVPTASQDVLLRHLAAGPTNCPPGYANHGTLATMTAPQTFVGDTVDGGLIRVCVVFP